MEYLNLINILVQSSNAKIFLVDNDQLNIFIIPLSLYLNSNYLLKFSAYDFFKA